MPKKSYFDQMRDAVAPRENKKLKGGGVVPCRLINPYFNYNFILSAIKEAENRTNLIEVGLAENKLSPLEKLGMCILLDLAYIELKPKNK